VKGIYEVHMIQLQQIKERSVCVIIVLYNCIYKAVVHWIHKSWILYLLYSQHPEHIL
jgi:hypothetical protein